MLFLHLFYRIMLNALLCYAVLVVQEYERGVVFRLGRAVRGGARGPDKKQRKSTQYNRGALHSYEREPCFTDMDLNNCANDKTIGDGDIGCCGFVLVFFSCIIFLITFPLSLCSSIHVVQEYERGVVFRLGRAVRGGARGPGIIFTLPCAEKFTLVDLRIKSFDIPPQEILSRDSVTVAVDAVIYCYVFDPVLSVCNIQDAFGSTRLLAATTLRTVLGTKNMSEMLSERDVISREMQQILDESTDPWGIKVERVEIKDVRLPHQLQRAMAAEAEASREARAKVLAAEGEMKASVSLREAANVMANSPGALQLRYLQTLNSIAAERNSTIVFPLPMELLKGMTNK